MQHFDMVADGGKLEKLCSYIPPLKLPPLDLTPLIELTPCRGGGSCVSQ